MDFRKQLIIFLSVNIGIIIALGIAIFFLNSDIQNRAANVSRLRIELNRRASATESLASLRENSTKVSPFIDEIEGYIPTRDQLVNFPRDLGIIANQNKISLTAALGKEDVETTSGLNKTQFILNTQGDFGSLMDALEKFQTGRYLMKINAFDLTRQQGNVFKISFEGETFSVANRQSRAN